THNPQIKSPIEKSKTAELRMILREWCAERGIVTRIDVTQTAPEFSSRRRRISLRAKGDRVVLCCVVKGAHSWRRRPRPSATSEFARVVDLAAADRPHLRGFNGHDRSRVAVEHHELDFVRVAIVIHVDDGPDVAFFQRLVWNWFREDDAVELVDHLSTL